MIALRRAFLSPIEDLSDWVDGNADTPILGIISVFITFTRLDQDF
jgi:hypothetical protein